MRVCVCADFNCLVCTCARSTTSKFFSMNADAGMCVYVCVYVHLSLVLSLSLSLSLSMSGCVSISVCVHMCPCVCVVVHGEGEGRGRQREIFLSSSPPTLPTSCKRERESEHSREITGLGGERESKREK